MHRALKQLFCSLLFGFSVCPLPTAAADADPATQRLEMVWTIEQYSRITSDIVGDDGLSPRVLDAMRTVKRHLFIPKRHQSMAYSDRPVEIGHGQTISQPFIVALMTHLIEPEPDDVVLEIGTGSGYQAAVLSPLVRKVCTIEIITELGEAAVENLAAQGYGNVKTKIADGYYGWPECGPFDGIVVTAAADHVPPPLVDQLKPGGRMVIPVGGMFATQHLTLLEKTGSGEVLTRQILPVRFVPFTRGVQ
jgi:protein-L-isoaspartate(D-aspartate) O-methyltransferase